MAEGKKSFVLYADIEESIEDMTNEEAGKLFKHILRYVNDKNPVTEDRIVRANFIPIKNQLKRDLEKWENIRVKRSEAGKASAKKRKQNKQVLTSVDFDKECSTNSTVSVNVNDNVNVINKKGWVYSNFEIKHFSWYNIKPIEKELQNELINVWNEEKERVGQKSYLKTLPETHTELYLQIRSIHTRDDVKNSLKALFQQKEIFNKTQHLDPTHFLNNFNKWFSAYNEGNKEVYVKKDKN